MIRTVNKSDYNPCTRSTEFHIETRPAKNNPWKLRAVVFNYRDARAISKMLRDYMK